MELNTDASSIPAHSRQATWIHPSVLIVGDVDIAENVQIAAHCVLKGPLRIESGCRIGVGCLIGGEPEHRNLRSSGTLVIGKDTVIREYCIIHHGTKELSTRIGSNCFIMNRTYIAHDCQIADEVTISAGVTLGGHVRICQAANLGMQVAVHQHTTIGAYSMVGMSTPVSKDVPPLSLVAGNPMRFLRVNQHAIVKLNLGTELVWAEHNALVYCSGNELISSLISDFEKFSTRSRLFEIVYASVSTPRKPR